MNKSKIKNLVLKYRKDLEKEELAENSVKKYIRDIERLIEYAEDTINKEFMIYYKKQLLKKYALSTVNSYLISANRFFKWAGYKEYIVKTNRLQKKSSLDEVISKREYDRMVNFAEVSNREKMYCIMKTIAYTGIRIGELSNITVESIERGSAEVFNKGKYRQIYFPQKLCDRLQEYCVRHSIKEGIIFRGKYDNKGISPSCVWKNLKYIARASGVDPGKVYPHSFRHLFAKTYMKQIGDITELANLLGHSRLETTWLYTQTTTEEKRERLNSLLL